MTVRVNLGGGNFADLEPELYEVDRELLYDGYRIDHQPSGDWAEAQSREAAETAAETLLEDNDQEGTCRVWHCQRLVDVVWIGPYGVFMHTSMRER